MRAINIVKAGLAGDMGSLNALVSPSAQFTVWRGDSGKGRGTGSAGAVDMAQDIHPTTFQTSVVRAPVYVSISALKCEWSTFVLLRTQRPETGFRVEFKFADGLLVSAEAQEVALFEGDVH